MLISRKSKTQNLGLTKTFIFTCAIYLFLVLIIFACLIYVQPFSIRNHEQEKVLTSKESKKQKRKIKEIAKDDLGHEAPNYCLPYFSHLV